MNPVILIILVVVISIDYSLRLKKAVEQIRKKGLSIVKPENIEPKVENNVKS
jgi:prolyl-tRNA editing enzyme YbaK/EbsC (Cys-tRNA(Pro) deacylase)